MAEHASSSLSILLIDEQVQDRSITAFTVLSAVSGVGLREVSGESEFQTAIRERSFALIITESKTSWALTSPLLSEIRQHQPQAAIVVFTSDGSEQVRSIAGEAGTADFIIKSSQGYLDLVQVAKQALEDAPRHAEAIAEAEALSEPPQTEAPPEEADLPEAEARFESLPIEAPPEEADLPEAEARFESPTIEAPPEEADLPEAEARFESLPIEAPPEQADLPEAEARFESLPIEAPPEQADLPEAEARFESLPSEAPPEEADLPEVETESFPEPVSVDDLPAEEVVPEPETESVPEPSAAMESPGEQSRQEFETDSSTMPEEVEHQMPDLEPPQAFEPLEEPAVEVPPVEELTAEVQSVDVTEQPEVAVTPSAGTSGWGKWAAVALAVIVGASLLFVFWNGDTTDRVSEDPIAETAEKAAGVSEEAPTEPSAQSAIADPETTESDSSDLEKETAEPSTEAVAPPPQPAEEPLPAPVTITLIASGEVWVAVSVDGQQVLDATLQAGEERTFEGQETASLRVGDAAGIGVSWNGQDLGSLGRPRQVRQLRFTPSRWWFGRSLPKPDDS